VGILANFETIEECFRNWYNADDVVEKVEKFNLLYYGALIPSYMRLRYYLILFMDLIFYSQFRMLFNLFDKTEIFITADVVSFIKEKQEDCDVNVFNVRKFLIFNIYFLRKKTHNIKLITIKKL
jgi:hypothetical protein